jgi:pyruvate/2-oxoacid:ferredoxin oxidoreductase beta subunit
MSEKITANDSAYPKFFQLHTEPMTKRVEGDSITFVQANLMPTSLHAVARPFLTSLIVSPVLELEAEAHNGPSLIIAYGQCIAHGIDMAKGMHQQKLAVESGYWQLYRYNPKLSEENKNPFQLNSHGPKIPLEDYIYTEGRYRMLQQSDPEVAKFLLAQAKKSVSHRWQQYKQMAQ